VVVSLPVRRAIPADASLIVYSRHLRAILARVDEWRARRTGRDWSTADETVCDALERLASSTCFDQLADIRATTREGLKAKAEAVHAATAWDFDGDLAPYLRLVSSLATDVLAESAA
jgi:hypothetical protein